MFYRGGAPTAQSYDKFSTPTIGSYQAPAGPTAGQGNVVCDPFFQQPLNLSLISLFKVKTTKG